MPDPKRRPALLSLAAAFIVAAAAVAGWWWFDGRWTTSTDDAYVQGNLVQLTPQIPGIVIRINADDTALVREGDPVVVLDAADTQTALDDEDLKHAQAQVETAVAALKVAEQQLAASEATVSRTTVATHPDVKQAAAKLRQSYLAAQRASVLAPVTGYVAKRSVQLGQQVAPGAPLLAIVPLVDVWVDANFKESQLRDVRIGQPVTLSADLYGGAILYHGSVIGLAPGTGSAFALLPPQNATGNWIKIVQRLPVRIRLDPQELAAHPLRVGLSMNASIDTHDRSGPVLASIPPTQPVAATQAYERVLADAGRLEREIVQANLGADGAAAAALGTSADQGTWVITSFAVSAAIAMPLTGWLGRRFGEVRVFLVCTAMFTIASLACGLSSSLAMLIAMRTIKGVFGGPMIPLSQSLLLNN